ncbi:MAG: hypothetical protein HQL32_02770 [Planctomycetes bacterium]|nr:hypothetical protein [Planctomycetota bacterium]
MNWPTDCTFTEGEEFPAFICPSSPLRSTDSPNANKRLKSYTATKFQRDTTRYEWSSFGVIGINEAINLVDVTLPANTVLMGEYWGPKNEIGNVISRDGTDGVDRVWYQHAFINKRDDARRYGERENILCHNSDGTANFAMIDGHVETWRIPSHVASKPNGQ